jgi:hypothetical protein
MSDVQQLCGSRHTQRARSGIEGTKCIERG